MEPTPAAHERPLAGGNVGRVTRVGDTVLRSAGPWTPTVQRLLAHLREAGLTWVPEPLGVRADGREAVTHLSGVVPTYPMPTWVWTEDNLRSMGRSLRRLHDATADFRGESACWRQPVRHPAEVVCHNDFAPYNMVFREHSLVGVIDFDMASPGPRLWDVAYLAYRIVPLMSPDNPDGLANEPERPRRLQALTEAYGMPFAASEVVAMAVERMRHLADFSDRMASETGNDDLLAHAVGYRADAEYLRGILSDL